MIIKYHREGLYCRRVCCYEHNTTRVQLVHMRFKQLHAETEAKGEMCTAVWVS
jgi:hypothetical protein